MFLGLGDWRNIFSFKLLPWHFKMLQKIFRNNFERRNTEAFFIRIFKPTLNDQCKHRNFSLFIWMPFAYICWALVNMMVSIFSTRWGSVALIRRVRLVIPTYCLLKIQKTDYLGLWATPLIRGQRATVMAMTNTFSNRSCVSHCQHLLYNFVLFIVS